MKNLGLLAVVLADLLGPTALGVGIGYYAVERWAGAWWVLLLASSAGLGLGMLRLYYRMKREIK